MAKEVREKSAQVDEVLPYGDIIESGINADDYLRKYMGERVEWVRGYVVKMSPVETRHSDLMGYLYVLLKTYLALTKSGKVVLDGVVMRLENIPSRRQPDLMVLLGDNVERVEKAYINGAADICIEIVSEESVARDYSEKLAEYRQGGVKEYWIIDPLQQQTIFWRLTDDGQYTSAELGADGNYSTPLLPKLKVHVPTLWRDDLPDIDEIFLAMQQTLKEDSDA